MNTTAAGHATQAGHGLLPQLPFPLYATVLGLLIAGALYCALTSNKIFRHLRRLGISILVAMALAGVGVGYVNHIHHARIAAGSSAPGGVSVTNTLLSAWGFGSLVLTIPIFLLATWIVRVVVRRRATRIGRGVRPRRGRRRAPEYQDPGLDQVLQALGPEGGEMGWLE